jgi:hypothetical protein
MLAHHLSVSARPNLRSNKCLSNHNHHQQKEKEVSALPNLRCAVLPLLELACMSTLLLLAVRYAYQPQPFIRREALRC